MELMKLYWLSKIPKSVTDMGLTLSDHILLKMNTILDLMILKQDKNYSNEELTKMQKEIDDWKTRIEQIL